MRQNASPKVVKMKAKRELEAMNASEARPQRTTSVSHRHLAERNNAEYRANDASVPSVAEILEEEWPRMEAAMRYLADR